MNLSDLKVESYEPTVEFVDEVAGVYFRSVLLARAGMLIEQHVHDHDHATYIGSGSVRLYVNGKAQGEHKAGKAIEVKAGVHHAFLSLEGNTRLTCVHNVASATSLKERGL